MLVQYGHVNSIFSTKTMIMQRRLFPNLVGESLLHFTEERAGVTARVSRVDVWVVGGVPFPRGNRDDIEVVQGSHCCSHWAPNHTPSGLLPHVGRCSGPGPGDVKLREPMLQFFSLELEPSPQLVQREPDAWIPFLSEVKVQNRRSACGLDPLAA